MEQKAAAQTEKMEKAARLFFEEASQEYAFFRCFWKKVKGRFPAAVFQVQKSQIKLMCGGCAFGYVWLPIRRVKNRPEHVAVVTFVLEEKLENARIVEAVSPGPGHWTHHVLTDGPQAADEELLDWLEQALTYAWRKKAR